MLDVNLFTKTKPPPNQHLLGPLKNPFKDKALKTYRPFFVKKIKFALDKAKKVRYLRSSLVKRSFLLRHILGWRRTLRVCF